MSFEQRADSPYGPLAASHKLVPLAELCEPENGIQTGPFGSQLHKADYVESEGTPIITVEHLGENVVEGEDAPLVGDADLERLQKYTLKEGDIVFSRVGSVDRRALVAREQVGWLFSGRLLRVRPEPQKVDPAYLSYFFGLPAFKAYIRSVAVGATMPSLNTNLLGAVPVILPPINTQRMVGQFLADIDLKIRMNIETATVLEGLVSRTFRSWFIDFDPVKAKMAGEAPVGMDAETAALFPDSMEESEMGLVPKGWTSARLGDLVELVGERATAGGPTLELAYVPIDQIDSKSIFLKNWLSGEEAKTSLVSFQQGDILFGAMRPYFHKVCLAPFAGTTRSTVFVLRPRDARSQMFSLMHLFSDSTIEFATNNSSGSTIPYAKWKGVLEDLRVVVPPAPLLDRLQELTEDLVNAGYGFLGENQTLSRLRDELLPRLISGELDIPNEMLVA